MAGRIFNGLSGAEIRKVLAQELDHTLRGDSRFDAPDPMKVTWRWVLTIETGDPRTPQTREVNLSGSHMAPNGPTVRAKIAEAIADHLSRDQTFAQHLAFPRVTWDWRLPMEIERMAGEVREVEVHPQGVVDFRAARKEGSEAGIVARRTVAEVPQGGLVVTGPDGQQYRMVPISPLHGIPANLPDGNAPPAVMRPDYLAQPRTSGPVAEHVTRFRTATGLPIEGGAQPSPGPAAAASHSGGSQVGAIAVEHAELAVSHPTLAEGGMGAPDRIRRDAGMPVPSVTKNPRTGVVSDLPGSIF